MTTMTATTDPYAPLLYPPLPGTHAGEPPKTEFGAGYAAPDDSRVLVLETLHAHERDPRIKFYEAPHLYVVTTDGTPHQVVKSVTKVAGTCSMPFDALGIIEGMKKPKSSNPQAWPRYGYCVDEAPLDEAAPFPKTRGIAAWSIDQWGKPFTHASIDSRAVSAAGLIGAPGSTVQAVLRLTLAKLRRPPSGPVNYTTFKRALTDDEIQAKWAAGARDASNRGTEAHFWAEQYLNGLALEPQPELALCQRFCAQHLLPAGARPYRTEWRIFTDMAVEGICGSVDLVVEFPDGSLGVVDWKRSTKLLGGMWCAFGNKTMLAPLDHLDECDGAKYSLQLNIYAYILETYYGKRVSSLTLVSLHPEQPYATDCPRMPLETAYLMAVQRRATAACRVLREEHVDLSDGPRVLCELSGAVRTNAKIIVATGQRVQHGAALELGCELADDPEGQRAVMAAIQAAKTPVEDEWLDQVSARLAAERVPWREMMPKPGLIHCLRNPCTGELVGQTAAGSSLGSAGSSVGSRSPKRRRDDE
jgi:hypothetical protein